MPSPSHEIYRFGRYWLSPSRHALYLGETEVPLAPKSFEVLLYLAKNPGRLITKEELLQAVWADAFIEEANLAQQIFRLRKAFETEPGAPNLIRTMPGRGYQFTAEVSSETLSTTTTTGVGGPSEDSTLEWTQGSYSVEHRRERTRMVMEEIAVPGHALPATATSSSTGKALYIAAAILVSGSLAFWGAWRWHVHARPTETQQIVLADFTNATGDSTFDRTLRRALEVDLEQSPYMDVMAERAGVSTLRMMGRSGDTPLTADVAREVCQRNNRKILLEGNIASVGPEYLITLEATDCVTGKRLTGAKAEVRDKAHVLATLDKVAENIRSSLGESAKSLASYQVPLSEATTPSLEALTAYSMGKYLAAQGRPDMEYKPFYERAIALDPHFAMAYGELSVIYYNNNDRATSKKYMAKAYQESGQVSAKERFTIEAHYYDQGLEDLLRANEAYRVWGETYPDEWAPWVDIANNDNELGLYAQAIPAGERALRLAPDRAINYSVPMRAYTGAGRFDDAKRIYQMAMQRKIDSSGINEFRFNIAYAEHDQKTLAETDAWGKANPDDWYYIDRKAAAAATSGRYKDAVALFRQAYDITKSEKLDDSADGIVADQAEVEIWLGLTAAARTTLTRLSADSEDGLDLMLVRTRLGDKTAARRFIDAHKDDSSTLMKFVSLPQARATVAIQDKKPMEAIAALEAARPYELQSAFVPTLLAEAFLQAKQEDQAIEEYKKIVANPGIDPICPLLPLAHLGLARAYALQHKVPESRREYETLFALWNEADSGLPVLQQARLEYAQLR